MNTAKTLTPEEIAALKKRPIDFSEVFHFHFIYMKMLN